MALTRDFRETVQARVKRDATFRKGLLSEAIESLLSGEVTLGKDPAEEDAGQLVFQSIVMVRKVGELAAEVVLERQPARRLRVRDCASCAIALS